MGNAWENNGKHIGKYGKGQHILIYGNNMGNNIGKTWENMGKHIGKYGKSMEIPYKWI